jgi:hypothetical protein
MTVCVDAASNMAVERAAGSHSLAAAGQRERSLRVTERGQCRVNACSVLRAMR